MATHQVIRTVTSHGHQYRQRVELYYDPRKRQTLTRVLESLGPVKPIYRRSGASTSVQFPLESPHLGLLATHIMMGSLTANLVIDTIREMGQEIPPGDLTAVGIRYDLGEKTLVLLLWLTPSSPHPRPAPTAKLPSSGTGPAASPTPSRSRARRA
jgi:hypothetical protein